MADQKVELQITADAAQATEQLKVTTQGLHDLSGALDPAAATKAVDLRKQFEALGTSTSQLNEAVKAVKPSSDQTGAALEAAFKTLGVRSVKAVEDEIAQLKAAMQTIRQSGSFLGPDHEKATASLKSKLAELDAELKGLPAATAPAANGVASVGSAAANAQQSIASATLKVGAMVTAFAGISSLGDVAKNVINTGASFETLRVRLEQLLGSQTKAAEAFRMIKDLAITTPFEVSALTESFAKLTSFGITPTEKQMRALSDTAAAAGGGQQNLERVSLALGQAWAKQRLQGDEILQLVEAGVPVWDLLTKATGKNVVELQKMSEAGSLGRDVILKLWDAMGEKSAGASERLMHTFAGTVSNAKDAMAEFFDLISRSGVLDYLTQQIQAVLNEFDKLKNNGELERKAKAISNAVVGMIDVLKTAMGIISEFSGVIMRMFEAMAVRSVIAFGVSLTGLGAAGGTAAAGVAAAGTASLVAGEKAGVAAIGVRALAGAMTLLKSAIPMTLLITGLEVLYTKFMAAKKAADDSDKAVAAMLSQQGTSGAAKAIMTVADTSAKASVAIAKLKNDIAALSGPALLEAGREFAQQMSKMGASTEDISKGLAEVGLRAAQSLGVDTTLAANKVSEAFKDSNNNLGVLINSLPNLKAQGVDTAAVVGIALAKMIDAAQSQAEIDLINQRLKELGQRGALTGEQVGAGLRQSADKAVELKDKLDASIIGVSGLAEAAKKAGVDISGMATGMGKAFRDSMGDFDTLVAKMVEAGVKAEKAGPLLAKALDQRLQAAQTKEEVQAVIDRLSKLGEQGKITGKDLSDGLEKARAKLDEIKPGVNSVAEAFKVFGLQTREEAQKIYETYNAAFMRLESSGKATTEQLQTAFKKYAEASIAANGGVADSLLISKAAALGLEIAIDETGKTIVRVMGSAKTAVDEVTTALERQNAAQENLNASLGKAAALERQRLAVDKEGFSTDKNGNRIAAGGELTTLTGIASFLKAAGVADEQKARSIAREFADSQGNITYFDNPGQMKYGGAGSTMSQAVLKAAEQYTFGIGNTGASQQPASIPTPAKSFTVNINMAGSNTPINTSSEADAQALIRVLQSAKLSSGL